MYSAMLSGGAVTDRTPYDISLERALIDAAFCACAFEVEMPLPSKIVPDYGCSRRVLPANKFVTVLCERTDAGED